MSLASENRAPALGRAANHIRVTTFAAAASVRIGGYSLEVGTQAGSFARFEPEQESENAQELAAALEEEPEERPAAGCRDRGVRGERRSGHGPDRGGRGAAASRSRGQAARPGDADRRDRFPARPARAARQGRAV